MTSKFNFKEEWYFLKQDIVSYTIATAVYIGLCLLREVTIQTFIYNLFNCLFFFMSFWYIRCRFDKTYHSDSWPHCKMWTRIMLVCGVFMLWLLPLEYSLFNALFVATICCLVLYLVAVEVEQKKSLIPTHKNIYAMNETELYEHYYGYYGDYGKNLSHEELEQWKSMLMRQVDDKDRQTFDINAVTQKAKQMGIQMHNFNEEELIVAMLIVYTDYGKILKQYVGNNMDIYIHLGAAFLNDEDSAVKGSVKLAIYYDCVVNA